MTAPSGPILPGRRCPWMRPPRAPRPVSLPAARAQHGRHPFPGPGTILSGCLYGSWCPRPAQSASGRCFHTPGGGSVVPLAGKETAGVGQRAPCRPRRAEWELALSRLSMHFCGMVFWLEKREVSKGNKGPPGLVGGRSRSRSRWMGARLPEIVGQCGRCREGGTRRLT